jgi:hypothetical protein
MHLLATYTTTRQIALCALVVLISVAGAFGQSPPVNDNFADRIPLTGSSLTITSTLAGATYESAEINALGGSVWWS